MLQSISATALFPFRKTTVTMTKKNRMKNILRRNNINNKLASTLRKDRRSVFDWREIYYRLLP